MAMQGSLLLCAALLAALCAHAAACFCPVYCVPNDAEKTGRYIAVLRDDTSRERLHVIVETINSYEGCTVHDYMDVAAKSILLGLSPDALQMVRSIDDVMYIEEEGISYAAQFGSGSGGMHDPLDYDDFWYLDRIDQLSTDPWTSYYRPLPEEREGVDVYILDSGIMYQHEEFDAHRVKYAGFDPGTFGATNGVDCNGHGTAVASLVHGITQKANLYSVRVFLNCEGYANAYDIGYGMMFVRSIVKTWGQRAIVVLPTSSSHSRFIDDMILLLYQHGIVVITAAGNDGNDSCLKSPANSPYVITVGSIDKHNKIATTSNYGPCVDLFAPGEDIRTASIECESCYSSRNGTSLAAALTAGVVAEYMSQTPRSSPASVKEILLHQTVKDVIDFSSVPENMRLLTPNRVLNRGCGGVVIVHVTETGVLQSPGFPGNYPSNMLCKWTLVAELDCDVVKLTFTHIVLEGNYDRLTVCLQDECSEEDLIVVTGDHGVPNCEFESRGRIMTIEMKTDSFTEAPGFRATHIALFNNPGMEQNRCLNDTCSFMKDSFIQLDVLSNGGNTGHAYQFSIQKNWREIYGGQKAGINLVVIDEVNGLIISTASFATNHPGNSDDLAMHIDDIPKGRIVCAGVSYDSIWYLNENAKRALRTIGSAIIDKLRPYWSWALIGVKGFLPGQAMESFSALFSAQVSVRVRLKSYHQQLFITAESHNDESIGYGRITRNDKVITACTSEERGLHIVVFDERCGTVLRVEIYIIPYEGDESESDDLMELMDSENNHYGTIVAIAAKEQEMDRLSESATRACEAIGSEMIRRVSYGESWAIVGRKGAAKHTVPESAAEDTSCNSTFVLIPSLAEQATCPVVMTSSVSENSRSITVNGVTITPSVKSHHVIILLGDGNCTIEQNETFQPEDKILSSFIRSVPPGRTVLVNLAPQDRSLAPLEASALRAIGSTGTDPWAIFGRKGAQSSSIVEQSRSGASNSLGMKTTLHAVTAPFVSVKTSRQSVSGRDGIQIIANSESHTLYEALVMVIFDTTESKIFQMHPFNMTISDLEELTSLIHLLRNGSVVALITNDALALKQSEAVREAIEGLGSNYISNVATNGGSWALIGRKGVKQGSVLEAASNDGPVEIVTHTLPVTPVENNTTCRIFVESAGSGSIGGLRLTVNTKTTTLPAEEGIRLVVMKQDSCEVESITTYPTHTNHTELNETISSIPIGTIVVASVYGSGREKGFNTNINDDESLNSVTHSMESIGSYQFSGVGNGVAWAIIGRKGAPPGSVPEAFIDSRSSAVAVGGVMELKLSCENQLYPLECYDY